MPSNKDSGVVNIHGKDYKTVAKRVNEFREAHGSKYAILTELVSMDENIVVMKAEILDDKRDVIATGYAEEHRNASQINKTSALENCETSAIGRALANFGLGGGEYASADEVANAINQQSKPGNRIDFNEVRRAIRVIDDVASLQDYCKSLGVEHMSEAQQKYINGIIGKRKKELEQ